MCEQDQEEWDWLIQYICHAKSVLEIGSRDGATIKLMARCLWPGARINSIDIGKHFIKGALEDLIAGLRTQGFDAELFAGDSHTAGALAWAKERCPYEFIFIDGDHSYAGVRQDWEWYGPLGKTVAFHDINEEHDGNVKKLWAEIKASGKYVTDEIILSPNSGYGIGVVIGPISKE
jgi:Methyltransferase domain